MKNTTKNSIIKVGEHTIKRLIAIFLGTVLILTLSSCSDSNSDEAAESTSAEETVSSTTVTINTSPDKYTRYIKNYVGKNCASIGYTAINGKRMDSYGEGLVELVFVSSDGSYIDVESEDMLKEYSVVKQNIAPDTVLKLVFDKDSEGNEYDNLVASQSYEEIVLCVKKNSSKEQNTLDLTEIKPAPDKYTRYIADYTGRNLASCGYISLSGDLMHRYGEGIVKLIIVADDGSYIDEDNKEELKNCIVTRQSIAPNTELKLTFEKDSDGVEYDNLIETQNIEEIELYVKRLAPSADTETEEEETAESEYGKTEDTTSSIPEASPSEETAKEQNLVDGMRPEFKAAMDSYEVFMNEYVDFMKKYTANPGDISLLMDYANYMGKYSDFVDDFEEWEDDDEMNMAETAYYIDVQARVNKKLLEVAE